MKITLTPAPLIHKKVVRDGFYVKQREDKYFLGHQHGETGDLHEVPISEIFYLEFITESQRIIEKYK